MKIEVGKKYILQNGWVVTIQRRSPSVILGDCPNGWTFNWDIDGTYYAGIRKGQDIVKEYEGEPMKNRYTAMLPGTITGHVMQTQHIQSLAKPAEFKVGDRVRVVSSPSISWPVGFEAVVVHVFRPYISVETDNGDTGTFLKDRFVHASETSEKDVGAALQYKIFSERNNICIHEYTNQSFMGVLMACKHCGEKQ